MTNKNKLRIIASYYGATLGFRRLPKGIHGYTECDRLHIVLDPRKLEGLSTLFHELGHIYCVQKGLFKDYHFPDWNSKSSIRNYSNTAYKAECWVDSWAAQEFKSIYPDKEYTRCYYFPGNPFKTQQSKEYFQEKYTSKLVSLLKLID